MLKDGCIKVWDTRSGIAVVKLRESGRVARALAWSRTKDHVLAAGELAVRMQCVSRCIVWIGVKVTSLPACRPKGLFCKGVSE